ncbi:MAG: hypothetical protein HYV68_03625 [Candidatus Taylorbacteria bacterium]|nr:hypothetical protein [Candidatus Taylorbacteria bacterium]
MSNSNSAFVDYKAVKAAYSVKQPHNSAARPFTREVAHPDQATPSNIRPLTPSINVRPLRRQTVKCYEAHRDDHQELIVTVDGKPLDPRVDLRNYYSTGFDCGYNGSGAAQLALAILADYLANDQVADRLSQEFKWQIVTELPDGGWRMNGKQIDEILASLRHQIR